MTRLTLIAGPLLASLAVSATVQGAAPPGPVLSAADRAAAFRAGGFSLQRGQWRGCDDPGTAAYQPGTIEEVRDLNGDGLPEAVISEGSSFCFGAAGVGYSLVSRQRGGQWTLMDRGEGMIRFLATRGAANWPDLEVGGPGFCHPVMRWNGRAYAFHRREYQGKSCRN